MLRRFRGMSSLRSPMVALVVGAAATSGFGQCFQWEHQELFRESGGQLGDSFGQAIAVSGAHLLVSAPRRGEVSAYHFDGDVWHFDQLLDDPPNAGNFFGHGVAMEGDLAALVVGDPSTVELYRRDPLTGWAWFQSLDPDPVDPADGDALGSAIAISNGGIFVGAPSQGPGRVFVFREGTTPGVWEEEAVLWAAEGESSDSFGEALDVEGDRLAVGAPRMGPTGTGAAFVFERDPATGAWERLRKITDETGAIRLGIGVALEGPDLFVGHRNVVHVYRYDGVTWRWAQDLSPSIGSSIQFGRAMSAREDTLAVVDGDHPSGSAVLTFRFDGTQWTEVWTCLPSSTGGDAEYVDQVTLSGGELIANDPDSNPGRVRFYRLSRLGLGLNTEEAFAGDDLRITLCAGIPGGPFALWVVAVNGSPFLQTLATGRFDATHQWKLETIVPPGLAGITLTLLGVGQVTADVVAPSLLRELTFR